MFNKDFIFGCATASYQIEGSIDKDSKVLSIWDNFTKIKGNIIDGSDGSIVCDSYIKYKDDVRLLKNLGVKAYRFSIAWTRVIDENNNPNQKGLDYYINLCKELLKNNITPYVTLYHWDLPQWIMDKGGVLNDEISDFFAYYTDVVTKALDGLVKDYITINEPQCIMHLGFRVGAHAPGLKYTDKEMLQAIHNLLLCHGKAVRIIRKNVKNSTIGFAPCSRPMVPVSEDKELYDKCYNKYFELVNDYEFPNRVSIYSDPIFLGDYPKEYYLVFKDILPKITKEDLKLISQPLDYIYQNIYTGNYYSLKDNELVKEDFYFGYPEGNIDWLQVVPKSIYYGVKYLNQRYKLPVIISENGFCSNDFISLDGKCHDMQRIDYIKRYLIELEKAFKELPIKGYFYWSLFDNFEWNSGLSKRFGLVYVDYRNGNRIEKDSYYAYKEIIEEALK
ncbi:MAG: family 1 glycosylhydrolase [Acholeplasmatales bacterium]|nr:family 1 glycosylhydrolase [Acholeplasmatales bacterium]